MRIDIHNRCSDFTSYRAARVKSLFNAESGCNFDLTAEMPIDDDSWRIGLVVGPSGSGKTSIGRAIWPDISLDEPAWPVNRPIIDAIAPRGDSSDHALGFHTTARLARLGRSKDANRR